MKSLVYLFGLMLLLTVKANSQESDNLASEAKSLFKPNLMLAKPVLVRGESFGLFSLLGDFGLIGQNQSKWNFVLKLKFFQTKKSATDNMESFRYSYREFSRSAWIHAIDLMAEYKIAQNEDKNISFYLIGGIANRAVINKKLLWRSDTDINFIQMNRIYNLLGPTGGMKIDGTSKNLKGNFELSFGKDMIGGNENIQAWYSDRKIDDSRRGDVVIHHKKFANIVEIGFGGGYRLSEKTTVGFNYWNTTWFGIYALRYDNTIMPSKKDLKMSVWSLSLEYLF